MSQRKRQKEESRNQMIDFFVNCLNANSIASCIGPNDSELTFWNYNGHVIISQLWNDGGWESYYQSQEVNIGKMQKEVENYFQ